TISTHERGDRLFPGTGFVDEMGEGDGVGYAVNLPLDVLTSSGIYLPPFEAVVPPLVTKFRPDVIVAQLGIDSHPTYPLTLLALAGQGCGRAVPRFVTRARRVLALGGGGYGLENVARAWTHAWALMNDLELPAEIPPAFFEQAAWFRFRSRSLWDAPAPPDRERCLHARDYAERPIDQIPRLVFPVHGL